MKVLLLQVQMLMSAQRLDFRTRNANICLSGRDIVAEFTEMYLEICCDMSVPVPVGYMRKNSVPMVNWIC